MNKLRRIQLYDNQANLYDRRRDNDGQRKYRQGLLRAAKGNVLELAVGAGANYPYYSENVKVTAVDFSSGMLQKAQAAAENYGIQSSFLCTDIEGLKFPEHTFDTVVSTLSLCSYDDPEGVLSNIKRWCKPTGSILLMEHGISSHSVIASMQRFLNPLLYRMNGCHFNRNIPQLIKESGLRIEKMEQYWLNMLYIITASPASR